CAPARRGGALPQVCGEMPLRAAGAQEGTNCVFPLLRITSFPSGRAARARVSDPERLPPGCGKRVSRTAATPQGRDAGHSPAGARIARPMHWISPDILSDTNTKEGITL